MRKIIEAYVYESAKTATPIDKWEKDFTYDGKSFYFKGKKLNSLSLEELESAIRYLDFEGIFKRWSLGKDVKESLLSDIWKCIPNNCYITVFGERGVVTHGIKNSKNFVYTDYDNKSQKYEGSWYLGMKISDGDSMILSKDAVPSNITYSDISSSFGKVHNFGKGNAGTSIAKGKKINYDDDTVIVYQNGKEIYKGLEDYEPMKNENWKWDNSKGYYTFKDYIKVCVG